MIEHPGLSWHDDLRTTTADGGHVNSRWYVTEALAEDVRAWYHRRLTGYVERTPGEWVHQRRQPGVRLLHSVRIQPADRPGEGPRPARPVPMEALTVVTDETALFPEA